LIYGAGSFLRDAWICDPQTSSAQEEDDEEEDERWFPHSATGY